MKKFRNIILSLFITALISCETYPDQEVEHSPIWPMAGEWLTYAYTQDGTPFGATTANQRGTRLTLRTYNTAANSSDQAWIRMGTNTQAPAIWGKISVNVNEKTFAGRDIPNDLFPGKTFSLNEAKVLLQATTTPSGAVADSIYINYIASDGITYTLRGHRRTAWTPTE
ncbi:lipid-binding protein [Desertivirga xinjiangensis]|uniref:lipid-binding protein n=1 Tax=Desertivirga xinjiangensis TaxID=539206 RepID=UPI00210C239D|nr:lipid-binding protein [Pedobacter xinjiangensis]